MPLTISRILHAGYVFEHGGTRIAFDPVFENPFSGNCHAFPEVRFDIEAIRALGLDAVFISHFHDDHCSLESLNLLHREIPIYFYCLFDELFDMIRALGFKAVYALSLDTPVKIGAMEIIPRRALESNVDSMFHVRVDNLNILNVVDASIDPATLRQLGRHAPWDMVMWPFQTMREAEVIAPSLAQPAPGTLPAEWLEQMERLNPRVIVPSSCQFRLESWSWYNRAFFPVSYAMFASEVKKALPSCDIVRLNPGRGIIIEKHGVKPANRLEWVLPVGEQNVDYEYTPDLTPPPTSDIATHLAPLTHEQATQVWRYCAEGIIEKYSTLEEAEGYFSSPRHWQLSVYDHLGSVRNFHYHVDATQLTLCTANDMPVAWRTEIAVQKLFAALFQGETLTSLYVRINDGHFDETTRKEQAETEIADDPLIRCVFDGEFATYQREQLRKLGLSL